MNRYPTEHWRREVRTAMTTLKLTTSVLNGPMAPKDAVRFTGNILEACRELDQLMRNQPDHPLARSDCASA